MRKYNFAASVENAEVLREEGIRRACIWSSIVMLAPWVVWAVPVVPIGVKWSVLAILWGVFPIVNSFHGQKNISKFSYQTKFPSLMSLPMSAVAYFSLSRDYPQFFSSYDSPLCIFSTLFLILVVSGFVNWIHFGIMVNVDSSISPKKPVLFTTRIKDLTKHRSKNSTSYYVHYIDHRLESDSHSISSSDYNNWRIGELLQLSVRTFVINTDGAYVESVRRLAVNPVSTDADELLFEKSQTSEFVKGAISNAHATVSRSGTLWFLFIVCSMLFMFLSDSDKCNFMSFGHPAYFIFLVLSFFLSILLALWERKKLLKICDYKSEPYNVWCDKLIKKLVLGTITFVTVFGLFILIYNKSCSSAIHSIESYRCTTESHYHSTKHGHYYTYHAVFCREGENVSRTLEIHGDEMDCNRIEIGVKKGLFGTPVIFKHRVFRE